MMTQVRKKSRFVAVKEVEKALVEGIWKLVHNLFLIITITITITIINMIIIVIISNIRSSWSAFSLTLFTKMIISIVNLCLRSL